MCCLSMLKKGEGEEESVVHRKNKRHEGVDTLPLRSEILLQPLP